MVIPEKYTQHLPYFMATLTLGFIWVYLLLIGLATSLASHKRGKVQKTARKKAKRQFSRPRKKHGKRKQRGN